MTIPSVTHHGCGNGASAEDLAPFIGKSVVGIELGEYELTITFSDGSAITAKGSTWDGCALQVDCDPTSAHP